MDVREKDGPTIVTQGMGRNVNLRRELRVKLNSFCILNMQVMRPWVDRYNAVRVSIETECAQSGVRLVDVVVVYAIHPFKIIKYGDAYHTCSLALYVHRAGFEPCTSMFSSRSFFSLIAFFYSYIRSFFHAYAAFFYPAYIAFFFTYINRVSGSPDYRFSGRKRKKYLLYRSTYQNFNPNSLLLILIQHTYLVEFTSVITSIFLPTQS
jgi:hypothetical protein